MESAYRVMEPREEISGDYIDEMKMNQSLSRYGNLHGNLRILGKRLVGNYLALYYAAGTFPCL